jgi:hypothetical protein
MMNRDARNVEDDESDVVGDEDEFRGIGATPPKVLEDHVKAEFEKDLWDAYELEQQIRQGSKEQKDMARVKFVNGRFENWKNTTLTNERNFLHFLAYHHEYDSKLCLQWVIARAIFKLPSLMGCMDSSKCTPLTMAISVGNDTFVYAACKDIGPKKKEVIRRALKSECEHRDIESGWTCLHTAISNNLDPDWTRIIIRFAPEMFSVVDSRGRTPLHLAVEYEKSPPQQVNIVIDLLARDSSALKIRTSATYGRYSAYQYHEKTRQDREDKESRAMKPPPVPARTVIFPDGGRRDENLDLNAKRGDKSKADRPSKDSKADPTTSKQAATRSAVATIPVR